MNQLKTKTTGHDRRSETRVSATAVGSCLNIYVDGRFDFNCHREFRHAYEEAAGPITEYVVDLKGTEYIDSAALGMLLVLREGVGAATVRIANSRPTVRKVLQIANFGSLFAIE